MSYQPEERYWTDYLRIALPVVGLLLMLGLFWFWAASLIGDEDDDDPGNVAAVSTQTPIPSPSPSPPPATEPAGDGAGTETQAAGDTEEETQSAGDTADNAGNEEDPDAADDEAPEGDTSADNGNGEETIVCETGDFCDGVIAVVTSDNVNVRSDPVLDDANVQGQFSEGDEVLVTSEPEDSEDYTWVQVEGTNADGEDLEGYVTTQFLEIE